MRNRSPAYPDGASARRIATETDDEVDEEAAPSPFSSRPLATEILPRGAVIGRFVIHRMLGVGGAGVVYAAHDPELDRTVALKLLRHELADRADARTRFLREAQALARLSHPNVITVYEVGAADGRTFIAMEYVAARTLGDWVEEVDPPWSEVLSVLIKAAHGLAAAHAAGLIHRDFKPANVLVGLDGRVVVTDFGLACAVIDRDGDGDGAGEVAGRSSRASALSARLTRHGAVQGTPAYMAPEQRAGEQPDARADQFSFCLTLHEALSRSRDLPEPAGHRGAASEADGPAWLRRAIERGLRRRPEERYASMEELLTELTREPLRRRRRRVAAVAALVAAAAGGGLFLAGRAASEPDEEFCSGGARSVARVWSPAAAARVAASFARTGRLHAQATARRVGERLDEVTAEWAGMHRAACAATARGEQSADLLDRRMLCLERRLGQVDVLVDRFAHADGDVVDRAADLLAGLAPLGSCADAADLLARPAPPASPALRASLSALERRVDRAEVDRKAGRAEQAAAAAREILTEERPLDRPGLAAQAGRVLGRALEDLTRPAEARTVLTSAQRAAERAGDTRLAIHLGIDLLRVVGVRQELYAEARVLEEVNAAALERPDLRNDVDLRTNLLAVLGSIATRERRLDRAVELQSEVLALRRRGRPALSEEVASAEDALGVAFRDKGRQDEARAHLREALATRRRLLGNQHPVTAYSLINLGITYLDDSDTAVARPYLNEALSILEKVPGARSYDSLLNNLGELERMAGDYRRSQALHERALDVRVRQLGPDHPLVAVSISCLGRAVREQGNVRQALEIHRRGAALFERIGSPDHPHNGSVLAEIGEDVRQLGRPAEALRNARQALAILRARTPEWMAIPLLYEGLALRDLGRRTEAIESLARAHAELSAIGMDGARAGFALARLLEPERPTTARTRGLAEQAHAVFDRLGATAQRDEAAAYLAGRASPR